MRLAIALGLAAGLLVACGGGKKDRDENPHRDAINRDCATAPQLVTDIKTLYREGKLPAEIVQAGDADMKYIDEVCGAEFKPDDPAVASRLQAAVAKLTKIKSAAK